MQGVVHVEPFEEDSPELLDSQLQLVFTATLNSDVTEAKVSPYFFFDKPDREKEEGERE